MKLKILLVFILFWVLTFPAFKALLHPGMMTGHDIEGHLVRLMEFDQALSDGHFPVRWSKRLDFGLGYPFFNFNYPFAYYVGEAIHGLGFDFVNSLKYAMLLSFPLGGFFAFLWLRKKLGDWAGLVGGAFYTLVPYHFLNVYVRGDLGETIALMFVPLVFYLIDRLFDDPTDLNCLFLALGLGVMAISHNITTMIFSAIWLVYAVFRFFIGREKQNKKFLILFSLSAVWGMALSAYFLIPALIYKQYTNLDFLIRRYYIDNFPAFKSLLYSPWAYGGSKVGIERGEMSFQIGLLHQLAAVLVIVLLLVLIRRKHDLQYKLAAFFAVLLLVIIFLVQDVSLPVWKLVYPLQYMEFPWRLLAVVSVVTAYLSGYLLFYSSRFLGKKRVVLVGIMLLSGLLYLNRNHWRANEYYTWIDYWKSSGGYFGTTTKAAEHIPKWHNGNEESLPYLQSRVVTGKAAIENLAWKTNWHSYRIAVTETALIVDRTDYFPGWKVFANGREVDMLNPYDPQAHGLIAFKLIPGEYSIDVKLGETKLEKSADALTVSALVAVLPVLLKSRLLKKGRHEKRVSVI